MNLDKAMFKFYVFTEYKRDVSAKLIHDNLLAIWHEETPGYSTICRWCNEIDKGNFSFNDKEKSGRPSTSCNDVNAAKVNEIVQEDNSISIDEIAEIVGISHGSVHTILRETLQMRCVYSVWVPYMLSDSVKQQRVACCQNLLDLFQTLGDEKFVKYAIEDETVVYFNEGPTKRGSRVWITKNEKRPQCVASRLSNRKTMLVIAYTSNKRISIEGYASGSTMDSEAYVNFIRKTGDKWRMLRSAPIHLSQLHWQHDNARSHVSAHTVAFCQNRHMSMVKQSPYSPDLNLLDRWINSRIKDYVRQGNFDSTEEIVDASLQCLRSIPESEYREQLLKLERHCQRVIDQNGDYITD